MLRSWANWFDLSVSQFYNGLWYCLISFLIDMVYFISVWAVHRYSPRLAKCNKAEEKSTFNVFGTISKVLYIWVFVRFLCNVASGITEICTICFSVAFAEVHLRNAFKFRVVTLKKLSVFNTCNQIFVYKWPIVYNVLWWIFYR